MKTILFACVHNAGRSQLAEALFNALADPLKVRAISAGSNPEKSIHPIVATVLDEMGMAPKGKVPKKITDVTEDIFLWITMGCGENCPIVPGAIRRDWPIEDPKGKDQNTVRKIRDQIQSQVEALLDEFEWRRK